MSYRCVLLATIIALAFPAHALAFDTGPHNDLTRDALAGEGFGDKAADVAAVDNWLVDFYSQAEKNPYSGHDSIGQRIVALAFFPEHWSQTVIDSSTVMHFDSTKTFAAGAETKELIDTAGETQEWYRLRRNTANALAAVKAAHDPLGLITVIGVSLHPVQDFYAHTNWTESPVAGQAGPGWAARGYGSFPTWFDVPQTVRDAATPTIQTGGAANVPRGHGTWKQDNNISLTTGMAKDWPGRPLFNEAYATSYFASRQWIEWMRIELGDNALWARAQHLAATSNLGHDLTGMHDISIEAGRWQGSGGPCDPSLSLSGGVSCGDVHGAGGNLIALRQAVNRYFDDGRSPLRRAFEHQMPTFGADLIPGVDQPALPDVPSSRTLQTQTQFVRLAITEIHGIDLGDPGPEEADMYANAGIGGQSFTSEIINGHDDFTFPRPYYPFTWLKAVSRTRTYPKPITSMTVRIHTGDVRYGGTDDDVYLRLSPTLRFPLDKSLYDDFERDDTDTYSVPIDDATHHGLSLDDIKQVTIEKSHDGIAGGWRLGGIKLVVNGSTFYDNQHIDTWLEDDHRTWTAPSITRDHRTSPTLGVWMQLRESDLLSADDDGDINPYDHRQTQTIAYSPGTDAQATVKGGSADEGRIANDDGDLAKLSYHLTTIRPVVPPTLPVILPPVVIAPPPPPPQPDLVVTALDGHTFTVMNQGAGAAGAFTVTVTRTPALNLSPATVAAGLAPGASVTQTYEPGSKCSSGVYHAVADSGNQITETDESNNTRDVYVGC